MSHEIEFDERKHEYRVDGVRKRSVTQIITLSGEVDDRWFTTEARDRGTLVHACVASGQYDERVAEYLHAWRLFEEQLKPRVLFREEKVYHDTLDYCGTLDLLCVLNGARTLIDIKTGATQPQHGLQLAGYRLALRSMGIHVDRSRVLELRRDCSYRLKDRAGSGEPFDSWYWERRFIACAAESMFVEDAL